MKAKELARLLLKYPELEVWFSSDIQIGEGGIKVKGFKRELAIESDIDGDEVDDEYFYEPDIPDNIPSNPDYHYSRRYDGYSKRIILLF